jgi:4-hydroxybenzoate polyprenyltransferase
MKAVGVVELAVGATILGIRPALGAYAASGWLVLVAVNLAIGGHLDIAVRDLVMSVAAFTLARMTELQTATITASPHWTVSASGSSVKGAYHRDHLSA